MRNIKTTLRTVRNTALLLSAMAGASCMSSCSNEVGPNQDPVKEPAMETGSYNVYGSNPNRVHNYGNGVTRAGETTAAESFEMPVVKEIPGDATELYMVDQWNPNNQLYGTFPAGNYVIPEGKEFNSQLNGVVGGEAVFYVKGKLHFSNLTPGHKVTVYVLDENAEFMVDAETVPADITIFNYGTFSYNNPYYKEGTFHLQGKLWSLTSLDFVENADCTNVQIEGTADVRCKGTITAKKIQIEGNGAACAIEAKDHIMMNCTGTFMTSYLEANTIEMNQSTVQLDNNGLIWAKEWFEATDAKGRVIVDGDNALLYTPLLKTRDENSLHINDNFADQNVKVVYNDVNFDLKNKTVSNLYQYGDVVSGIDAYGQAMGVNAAGCHGAFAPTGKPEDPFAPSDTDPITPAPEDPDDPTPDPTPDYVLIPVADIENPDVEDPFNHDHGTISATCISFGDNGTAFASFHRRGNANSDYNDPFEGEGDAKGHKGCIEKIVNNNGVFALESFMIAPEWDFNHILADGNRVITVGNHVKKGAFIGALPVDFAASEGVRDDFEVMELTTDEVIYVTSDKTGEQIKGGYKNAGDGNCVVRVGDLYYVATFRGYGALNTDFSKAGAFTETAGSSKHIALGGDKMAVLSLDSYDKGINESAATVKEFGLGDFNFASVLNEYAAGANVAPIDGKNTIAYSGNDLFACLGKGGLSKNGAAFFQRGKEVPANGVAIVGDYIFVANGSFLDVIDKSGNRLCHYHDKNLHSANYVAIDGNGFIYVAFGKSDIKIFKLGGAKVAADWHIAGK